MSLFANLTAIWDHFYYTNAPHLYSKSGLGFVLTPSIAKKLLVQNCDFEFSLLSGRAETPCQNAIQKPQKAMKWCCARENDTDRVNWDYELVHMRHFHDFGQSDQFRPYWHNLFCILVTLAICKFFELVWPKHDFSSWIRIAQFGQGR